MKRYKYCFFLVFIFILILFHGCTNEKIINISFIDQSDVFYMSVEKEEKFFLPSPVKTGYTFGGWFYDQKFQNQCTEDDLKEAKSLDIVLYSQWIPNTYKMTLCFDEENLHVVTALYNSEIKLQEYSSEHQDYTLSGWSTSEGTSYNINDSFLMPAYDLYLYPIMSKVIVKFETNGGSAIPSFAYNDLVQTDNISIPQKLGYDFQGWFLDKNFTQEFDINIEPKKDITLFAKWTEKNYTITYDMDGGQEDEKLPTQFTITSPDICLPVLKKTGYTFLGWFDGDKKVEIIPIGTCQDLKLKACWKARKAVKISILTPLKMCYFIDEPLELTKLKINVLYDNDESEILCEDDFEISGYDCTKLGKQKVTIDYLDLTESFEVTVISCSITEISVSIQKDEYIQGQELDLEYAKILIFYDSGKELEISLMPENISGYDMNKIGVQRIQIFYQGHNAELEISILPKTLIEIQAIGYKTQYNYMQEFSQEGKLKLIYDNGTAEEIPLYNAIITNFDSYKAGEQNLTVSYLNFTDNIIVTVLEPPKIASKIELVEIPKTEYELGENLDVLGGYINVVFDNQYYLEERIAITAGMVSGFDSSLLCENLELKIEYQGAECSYTINVSDNLGKIFVFEETDDGQAYSIIGLKDKSITEVIIPSIYKGKPVISIGKDAFADSLINEIAIPSNIIEIGRNAFLDSSFLTKITINARENELVFGLGVFNRFHNIDFYILCELDYFSYFELSYEYCINFFTYDKSIYQRLRAEGIFNSVLIK